MRRLSPPTSSPVASLRASPSHCFFDARIPLGFFSESYRWRVRSRLVTSAGSRTKTPSARTSMWLPIRFARTAANAPKRASPGVRHLYLDLDTDGEARLASLRTSDAVPTPNAIVSTSLGKYQILWRVDGFTLEQQESALKLLAVTFGGDPACTDCNRVLRLPGFLNCKYDPAYPVTVEYPGDSNWNSDDFRLDILAADALLSPRSITPRKHSDNHTNSERDWAWVLDELTKGKDAAKLTRKLASRRADKPNPLYYAQRTVDVASARLWLIEGVPIEDVVTLLVVRRRFEIPIALCSARAREIALTAQRMIARRKIA